MLSVGTFACAVAAIWALVALVRWARRWWLRQDITRLCPACRTEILNDLKPTLPLPRADTVDLTSRRRKR